MREKITIEKFQKIKEEMNKLENKVNNTDYLEQSEETEIYNQYIELQEELLSYDLSDIPFEIWEGMNFCGDDNYTIDFSKTNANLDFRLVNISDKANFKNCKVRNIQFLGRNMSEDYFDKETIANNQDVFLSNNFSHDFKQKYYYHILSVSDLINLTIDQLKELEQKNVIKHLTISNDFKVLYQILGINSFIELFKQSENDLEIVCNLVDYILFQKYKINIFEISNDKISEIMDLDFVKELKNKGIKDIKTYCYTYTRNLIITNPNVCIILNTIPEQFVKDNEDLFLTEVNMPDDLRRHYYNKSLSITDIIKNYHFFKDIDIGYFLSFPPQIVEALGQENITTMLKQHWKLFKYIANSELDSLNFAKMFSRTKDYNITLASAVKKYLYTHYNNELDSLPEWASSLNFNFVTEYTSWNDFITYDNNTIIGNYEQRTLLNLFGFENLKRFNEETNFFTHSIFNSNSELSNLDLIASFIIKKDPDYCDYLHFDNLTYDQFLEEFAKILDKMRFNNSFSANNNYDFIEGPFRDNHPEIFIDKNAPKELKDAFYVHSLTIELLQKHPEYIPYITDKNLYRTICGDFIFSFKNEKSYYTIDSFIDFYSKKFGNEETIKLLTKYGTLFLDELRGPVVIHYDDSKETIEDKLTTIIYNKIIKSKNIEYRQLKSNKIFFNKYPELFIDLSDVQNLTDDEKSKLTNDFYARKITFETIQRYPQLAEILKDKNLYWCCNINFRDDIKDGILIQKGIFSHISEKDFLDCCCKYGRYMNSVINNGLENIYNYNPLMEHVIKDIIKNDCLNGLIAYSPDDAPDFLKQDCPSLFLDEDAPLKLKNEFYGSLNFYLLHDNKDWLPYLKNKNVVPSFLKGADNILSDSINFYFFAFGSKALSIGVNKPETVTKMIGSRKVGLMKDWFEKTNRKFIPDYVVMQNIQIEESDKFLSSINFWSKLMKIESFANTEESREAMLKLAYSFGIFDQDQAGFKKLTELLSGIPHTLSSDDYNKIDVRYIKENDLKSSLKKEGFEVKDDINIIEQLYKPSSNNNYVITINPAQYPKSMQLLRQYMEKLPVPIVMTPKMAHQYFGGFKLEYDKDFREFLLANLDKINENNSSYISSIQRQFKDIKAINSNRVLTFDLALNYVMQNKYENIELGNEKMAEIASIAGYSQDDFITLQQIYNYGKTRIFSSIPRIVNKNEKYIYETLKLDDPLALAIGTLTDCCQELHNAAEVCMVHSMVDKNGRVFVIKDHEGNIVAQSWVWRNKNVLCFDNIEIPDKAFKRAELNKNNLAQEVYDTYKQAAKELMEEDEKVYKKLLDDGKITKEQYEGLKLNKITVGLGYNDIATVIKKNATRDNSKLSRPLDFKSPVNLNHSLYTSDSETQYILEEQKNNTQYDGDTLAVHSDVYTIYDNSNFTEKEMLQLNKLELSTTENIYLNTQTNKYSNSDNLVSNIAYNYDLDPNTTKIILHPNFAIIYDENDSEIKLGDILYNTSIDIENIIIQIKLALEQIAENKTINTSILEDYASEIYNKVQEIADFDSFKGIKY